MVTSSLSPLSRKISHPFCHEDIVGSLERFPNIHKDLPWHVWVRYVLILRLLTTNLVIQSSSHAANWNTLVGNLAGSVYSSSTKSNLVASSFGKISFQDMKQNSMVNWCILELLLYMKRKPFWNDAREVHVEAMLLLNHMWLELVLCSP